MRSYWICPDALDGLEAKVTTLAGQSSIPIDGLMGYGFRGENADIPRLGFKDAASMHAFEHSLEALPHSPLSTWIAKRHAIIDLIS